MGAQRWQDGGKKKGGSPKTFLRIKHRRGEKRFSIFSSRSLAEDGSVRNVREEKGHQNLTAERQKWRFLFETSPQKG